MFLNIAEYFKTLRCGCGAVSVIFFYLLKTSTVNTLVALHYCPNILIRINVFSKSVSSIFVIASYGLIVDDNSMVSVTKIYDNFCSLNIICTDYHKRTTRKYMYAVSAKSCYFMKIHSVLPFDVMTSYSMTP